MTFAGWLTIFVFVLVLSVLAMPLGRYMAAVYTGEHTFLDPVFRTPEELLYKILRVNPAHGQNWKQYTISILLFSTVMFLFGFALLQCQAWLPLNPDVYYIDRLPIHVDPTSVIAAASAVRS